MISVFRKNDVVNIFLLLPYTILLRFYSLLHPQAYQINNIDTIVSAGIFDLISTPIAQSILAILFVYAQAILINIISNNNRLHRQPSALAGMFYILLASCIPELQHLTPALIGMTFILFAVMNIFRTYNLNSAAKSIFNAALASSAAAIIYMPYVLAIVALFVGLAMIRNFRFNERLQFIIGYGTLMWIIGAFLYFFGLLNWDFLDLLKFPGTFYDISYRAPETIWGLVVASILVLVSLFNYYNFMKKKGIDIRKKIDFFYWLMLCSLIALIVFRGLGYQHYYFVMASLSLFLSMAILLIRNMALVELIHVFSLIAIFYLQFS